MKLIGGPWNGRELPDDGTVIYAKHESKWHRYERKAGAYYWTGAAPAAGPSGHDQMEVQNAKG